MQRLTGKVTAANKRKNSQHSNIQTFQHVKYLNVFIGTKLLEVLSDGLFNQLADFFT
jgi:hypothetical protein